MDLCLAVTYRSASKNPIDGSPVLQECARCRWHVLVRKCVQKLSTADCGSRRSIGYIEIEITRKQNGRVRVVSPCIVQDLVKLEAAQLIIASALQMQVVGNYCFARNVGLADQRYTSSEPLLKRGDFGKKPVRTPEMRLLLESDDPRT